MILILFYQLYIYIYCLPISTGWKITRFNGKNKTWMVVSSIINPIALSLEIFINFLIQVVSMIYFIGIRLLGLIFGLQICLRIEGLGYNLQICSMNSLISFHMYMYMRWSILKTRFYFIFLFYVNTLILSVILNNQLLYSSFLVQVICKNYCLTHLEHGEECIYSLMAAIQRGVGYLIVNIWQWKKR